MSRRRRRRARRTGRGPRADSRKLQFIHQPLASGRIGDRLKQNLAAPWTRFRAAIAFVKRSGTRHVAPALAEFARTRQVEIIVGIDHGGSSAEGLRDLLDAVSPSGRVIVFHNRLPFTFHPKVYLFQSPGAADLTIGSGNLTEGGLFTNYEAALHVSLRLADPRDAAVLRSIEQTLDSWADLSTGAALVLDDALLTRLTASGLTPSETAGPSASGGAKGGDGGRTDSADSPFAARTEPGPPAVPVRRDVQEASPGADTPTSAGRIGFVMTLQQTDAGVGQTSTGTSRRSPEIFVPLAARDAEPGFWGWPEAFTEDPDKPGKRDRREVPMLLDGKVIRVSMMTWPDRHDFRLRNEKLRSAGRAGDILRIEKAEPGVGHEYAVEVIGQGTNRHAESLALCRRVVRNSEKKYGYY